MYLSVCICLFIYLCSLYFIIHSYPKIWFLKNQYLYRYIFPLIIHWKCWISTLFYYLMISGVFVITHKKRLEFLTLLNQHNSSTGLKPTTSSTVDDSLHTSVFKRENFWNSHRLDIQVFFKESDAHALLHRICFYLKNIWNVLVKPQLLWFHRMLTRDFMEAIRALFRALSSGGYSCSFWKITLKEFPGTMPPYMSAIIPLITTFQRPC